MTSQMNMKIDMHQPPFESIQISSDEDWYDSNSYESIQAKSESFMTRFTNIGIDSGKEEVKNWCWQHLNRFKKTVNQFNVNQFTKTMNWFITILFRKIWLDSKGVTHGKWAKGMLDMNQWIMNRIKKFTEGFSIYDNTQDIMESHDTMRHGLLGSWTSF